jgi:hypothetical protein
VPELTPFQAKCEAALAASLARVGARLVDRQLSGSRETYIRARIAGTGMEVYIYSDEAQVQGLGVDERFESPDFDTGDLLCEAFVRKAVELAKEAVV